MPKTETNRNTKNQAAAPPSPSEEERDVLRRVGLKLARLREIHHMTQRDVQRATGGRILAQQLSRLETGQVERPSLHDTSLLAALYGLTPNDMAELYGYWTPRTATEEPEDPRVRRAKQVARTLSEAQRERLYNNIEIATVLVETETP